MKRLIQFKLEVHPSEGLHSSTSAFVTDLQQTSEFDREEGLRYAAESKREEFYQKVRYATICVRTDAGIYKYMYIYLLKKLHQLSESPV